MERLAERTTVLPEPVAPAPARTDVPSRLSSLVFAAKVTALQARRAGRDLVSGPRRHGRAALDDYPVILAQSRTPLWSDRQAHERLYQRGKVHNLRRVAAALARTLVPAGEVFSFWRQVGRASRRRGYVTGRMLQQGCLVPSTGGGLCQISNALYEAALDSGCEIVERHGYSRIVPGSAAAVGRDATVAWNYVDFRFRPTRPLLIEARLTRDELVIRFRGQAGAQRPSRRRTDGAPELAAFLEAQSCAGCDETACFRHEARPSADATRTAYLLDENWPEFQAYVAAAQAPADLLGVPLAAGRWTPRRYRWPAAGFARTGSAPVETLARTLAVRRVADQGAARRAAELDGAAAIAVRLGRLAGVEVERLCVSQSLLPFLWRDGVLGGRAFEVLMTRLPIGALQARLDAAFAAHPDRGSLGDFRAPAWLARAEAEALAAADRIVTPHAEIAGMFPGRALRLDWRTPSVAPLAAPLARRRIVFPGPTVARKGAWEVRDAARARGLQVVLLGSELEGDDFWNGVDVLRPDANAGVSWLDGAAAVVQPALVEDQPRRLLAALAAGVPVVATAACGLGAREGLVVVPPGDADALTAALGDIAG